MEGRDKPDHDNEIDSINAGSALVRLGGKLGWHGRTRRAARRPARSRHMSRDRIADIADVVQEQLGCLGPSKAESVLPYLSAVQRQCRTCGLAEVLIEESAEAAA